MVSFTQSMNDDQLMGDGRPTLIQIDRSIVTGRSADTDRLLVQIGLRTGSLLAPTCLRTSRSKSRLSVRQADRRADWSSLNNGKNGLRYASLKEPRMAYGAEHACYG